jgi:hypothetical protein
VGAGLIGSSLEGDVAAGDTDHSKYDARGDSQNNNTRGIHTALCLRIELAILAGQCLSKMGEMERALTVYSEGMRYNISKILLMIEDRNKQQATQTTMGSRDFSISPHLSSCTPFNLQIVAAWQH